MQMRTHDEDNVGPSELGSALEGYSLEVTAKDANSLRDVSDDIPPKTAISVTFLPGEEMEARVAAAKLVRSLGFEPVPHISARRLRSSEELKEYLVRLQEAAAINRVFAIAGDLSAPLGPYDDALAIIQSAELLESGVKHVSISGYPEGHPQISEIKLWDALRTKYRVLKERGANVEIMTQFSFDAAPVLRWLARVREELDITATVRVGLPGPATVKTLLRFASICGVGATASVMAKYGVSITQLLSTARPQRLLSAYMEQLRPGVHGSVRFHFYPFGGLRNTVSWVESNRDLVQQEA
jgi:methylenetetrahydrofolate reductase (NADPH)